MKSELLEAHLRDSNTFYQKDYPLKDHTTFRIGGQARYYAHPESICQLQGLVKTCRECDVNYYTLGNGSNLLIRDQMLDAVVIDLSLLSDCSINKFTMQAQAGCRLSHLIRMSLYNELAGLEHLAGIPASVGGAVSMNAGGRYGDIAGAVVSIEVIDDNGDIKEFTKSELSFNYRSSNGLASFIVVGVIFELRPEASSSIYETYKSVLNDRRNSQPVNTYNAGCIFKNPPNNFAGRLIDECGLKSSRIGDAYVSQKHANFIINLAHATSADVLKLIEIIRGTVDKRFSIELELEIKIW